MQMGDTNEEIALQRAKRVITIREAFKYSSRREFAFKLNIPANTLQNWEKGLYGGLAEKGAKRLVEAFKKVGFNCTVEWLLYGIGDNPLETLENHSKPVNEQLIIAQELKYFLKLNPDTVSAVIADNSMLPCYQPGDHIAGKRYFSEEINKAINSVCIIQPLLGNLQVRKLEFGSKPGYFNLICTNEKYRNTHTKFDVQILYAAPVIWIRRSLVNKTILSELEPIHS